MSNKGLLGIDLAEWNSLSGLSDPYALELAQISAKAGVPRLNEARAKPSTDDEKRVALIKTRHRKLRAQGKGAQGKGSYTQLSKLTRQQSEDGEQLIFPYDVYLEAFLEDNDLSLYEFNELLYHAVEDNDVELQDNLLALESILDDELEEAFGAAVLGGMKAVKGAVGGAAKAGFKIAKKGVKVGADAAKGLAGQVKSGFQSGMKAAGDAATANAAAPGAGAAAAPPAPTADAPAPGGAPSGASDAPPGGGAPTANAAPSQPGQTTKKKKPSALGLIGKGLGKVAKGVVGATNSAVSGAVKGAGKLGGGMKKGYKGEDIEYWEEFLGENGLTIDEYISVVEQAYEFGDDEMIESSHQLDEIFAAWKAKKAKASADQRAKVDAGWDKARAVQAKYGKDATKQASVKGQDVRRVAKPKAVNETVDWMLQMSGYTDEYIEGRSKDQQMAGARASAAAGPGQDTSSVANWSKKSLRGGGGGNDPLATLAKSAKDQGKGRVKMSRSGMRSDPGYALSNSGGKKRPLAKLVRREKGVEEGRSAKSAEKKARQYQGLTKSNSDDFISKQASRKGGRKLNRLVDDPNNELAPQLIKTLRRTRK